MAQQIFAWAASFLVSANNKWLVKNRGLFLVKFHSIPSNSDVTISEVTGKLTPTNCVTPCVKELNRKHTYSIAFEKEGYKKLVAILEPKFSADGAAGMAGNILIGGVIGAAVDGATGAMNDLKPNPMTALLAPIDSDQKSKLEGVVSRSR